MKIKQIIALAKNINTYNFYLYNDFREENLNEIVLKTKPIKLKGGRIGWLGNKTIYLDYHEPSFNNISGKKVLGDEYIGKTNERPTHYYLNRRISDKVSETIFFIDNCINLKLDSFYFRVDKETGRKSLDFILVYEEK